MGRVFLLFLSLILFLTPACSAFSRTEAIPGGGTPVLSRPPDAAATDPGDADKGQKPAVPATDEPAAAGPAEGGAHAVWTILVYMNAGPDEEAHAMQTVAEMQAAGRSAAVNLLVQIGNDRDASGGARRSVVTEAEDLGTASAVEAEVDQVEMSEPAVLADFIRWGLDNYPATHYALLLWDGYGGGWRGLGVDAEGGAYLSPGALSEALSEVPTLDLIAFDAGGMGHLEVYQALQPFARYAVASPAPLPRRTGRYQRFLGALYATPDVDAAALAELLASTLADPGSGVEMERQALMTIVDLQALPAVTNALDDLADILAEAPDLAAPAVADARAGAEMYLALSPADKALAAVVDLGDFAGRLARRSPDPAIAGRARAVVAAVTRAVEQSEQGGARAPSAPGIAIYFPPDATVYEPAYAELPFLESWQRFLSAYHASGLASEDSPGVDIVHRAGEVAGIEQPAYIDFELAAREVEDVAVVVGQREEDGALRLLATYPQRPAAGFERFRWRDGLHEGRFVWETEGGYLSNGSNGDFVLLWPLPGEELNAVAGRLRPAGDGRWQEATLIFEGETGALASGWVYPGDHRRGVPRPYAPQPGDLFQVYDFYLEEGAGAAPLRGEPGLTLTYPATNTLRSEMQPLPGGQEYDLGVVAETRAGWTTTFITLTVNNPEESVPTRAYLDPDYGFQFFYPATWETPAYDQGSLLAAAPGGDTRLTVSFYPDSAAGAAVLKAETLQDFGVVDILYEEDILVGETGGMLTAYGYEAGDGGRTGLFFTFVHEDVGYVVDVDGPADQERETIALVNQVVDSWLFRPLGREDSPGQWTVAESGEGLPNYVPVGYRYEALDNGWQRFSGEGGFVAFRHEPAAGDGREAIVARWLAIAGEEVASFAPEPAFPVALAGNRWVRANFTYEGNAGVMRGFVMATIQGEEEVVAWAEGSADGFSRLEREVLLVLVAEYLANRPGEAGLMYEASFNPAGAWGTGTVAGARGEVADRTYQLAAEAEEGFFWATAGKHFGNATYEITATQTAGPLDSGYGLLLRADNKAGAFYVLEISGDGYAWVGRCHEGCERAVALAGEGWFPVAAVHTGLNAPNRLRVEAAGTRLLFFVNEQQIAEVADAVLSEGDVGLFVETLGEGGVTVTFSDLRVLAP